MQLLLRKTLAFVVACLLFYIFSAKTTEDGTACGILTRKLQNLHHHYSIVSRERTECVSLMYVMWFCWWFIKIIVERLYVETLRGHGIVCFF
jgi:hypothetical protein